MKGGPRPGCPALRETAGLLRCARPWPPFARLRPLRPAAGGLASLRASLPAWAPAAGGRAGPGSGPFAPLGSLRAARPLAGRLRPSLAPSAAPRRAALRRCRSRRSPGLPRRPLGPLLGGSAGRPWPAPGSLVVALCGAAGFPAPLASSRRVPAPRAPSGFGSFLPPGAAGRAAPAFSRRRPRR